jgi:hypothetical protein
MKKMSFLFFSATFALLQSCNSNETPKEETAVTPAVTGADMDAHGCKGSAGYTWSELKQNCIRVFEDGTKLTAAVSTIDQTTAAFVVFNTDSSKAELFIPNITSSVVIDKQAANTWKDSTFSLSNNQTHLILEKGSKILYKN